MSGDEVGPAGKGWAPPPTEHDPPTSSGGFGPPVTPPSATPGAVVGEVRGKEMRTESSPVDQRQRSVWTFRLERFDADGNRLQPVPVELLGRNLTGVLRDGDIVEVNSPWVEGQTLHVREVRNLTNGGSVVYVTDRIRSIWLTVFIAIVVVVTLMWLAYGFYRTVIDPVGPPTPGFPRQP